MERLTIPDVIVDKKTTRRTIIDGSEVRKYAMEFYWRLKLVEDILGDEYDIDRLRELVEADRDGRCVVLPCKVGDKLFYMDDCEVCTEVVEKIVVEIETDGGIYRPRDIGYSVYTTREAAEAALKGESKVPKGIDMPILNGKWIKDGWYTGG